MTAFAELEGIVGAIAELHETGRDAEIAPLLWDLRERRLERERADDHLRFRFAVRELSNGISALLGAPSTPLPTVAAAAALVRSMATEFVPAAFFAAEVSESHIAVSVAAALANIVAAGSSGSKDRGDALSSVLGCLHELSFDQAVVTQITSDGPFVSLLPALVDGSLPDPELTLEILWNVLELRPEALARASLQKLSKALLGALQKAEASQMRTKEILLCCAMVAENSDCFSAFNISGLLDQLICTSDSALSGSASSRGSISEVGNALEVLRLTWSAIFSVLSRIGPHRLSHSQEDLLASSLLARIADPKALTAPQADPALRELCSRALRVLRRVVELCPTAFKDEGGIAALASLIFALAHARVAPSLLVPALRLACDVAGTFPVELGSTDAFPAMLALLVRRDLPLGAVATALTCIARLCRGSVQCKAAMRGAAMVAVAALVRFNAQDPSQSEEVAITAVDAAWAAIAEDEPNATAFVASKGVEAALSLASVCPPFMRPMMVGFLADLCRVNVVARERVRSWKGTPSLLSRFWEDEQMRLAVHTEADGALAKGPRPLLSARERRIRNEWRRERMLPEEPGDSAEANGRLAGSARVLRGASARGAVDAIDMRPRLHCLASTLGDGLFESAKPNEHATLAVVLEFEGITTGQTLHDIAEELSAEGTEPVPEDAAALSSAFARSEACADTARAEQRSQMAMQRKQQLEAERDAFRELLRNRPELQL